LTGFGRGARNGLPRTWLGWPPVSRWISCSAGHTPAVEEDSAHRTVRTSRRATRERRSCV